MRFRPHGNTTTRRIVRLAAMTIAVSAMIACAPVVAADAATNASPTSVTNGKTHRVPAVVGWIAPNAVAALGARGFVTNLKPPPGQKVVKAASWTVTKQSPKRGTHVSVGSKVTLSVIKTTTYLAQGIRSFYSQDYRTFAAIIRTGTGERSFTLPKGIKCAIVVSSYSGSGRFTVSELSAGNVATNRVLVSATKSYVGTQAFGLVPVKARTTAIKVSGSGTWRITIKPIAAAPIIKVPVKSSGDGVYLYSGPSAMWTVSSPGPTTFILNQISSSSYPNLAVNESGNWAGPVALQPGPSVIEIHSNGAWTIH